MLQRAAGTVQAVMHRCGYVMKGNKLVGDLAEKGGCHWLGLRRTCTGPSRPRGCTWRWQRRARRGGDRQLRQPLWHGARPELRWRWVCERREFNNEEEKDRKRDSKEEGERERGSIAPQPRPHPRGCQPAGPPCRVSGPGSRPRRGGHRGRRGWYPPLPQQWQRGGGR